MKKPRTEPAKVRDDEPLPVNMGKCALLVALGCPADRLDEVSRRLTGPLPSTLAEMVEKAREAIG